MLAVSLHLFQPFGPPNPNTFALPAVQSTEGIVSALLAADTLPLAGLQAQAGSVDVQISALGRVASLAASLQNAATALAEPAFFAQTTASSSNGAVLSAVTTGTAAVPGTHSVTVQQIAQAQTVTAGTPAASASTAWDSGTLTIQLGTWGGASPSFTPQAGAAAVTVTIPTTANSLSGIRDAINAANAGVQASLVTDSSGVRLSLSASATGAANGFRVTTTDNHNVAGGLPLSSLAYDPGNGNAPMVLNQAAQDARATVDGSVLQSASNTLVSAVPGLDLPLPPPPAAPVTVTVAPDTGRMGAALGGFVDQWNRLNSALSQGAGAPPLRTLREQMLAALGADVTASGNEHTLAQIGVSMRQDGSLAIDPTGLGGALQDTASASTLLARAGSTAADTGVMVQVGQVVAQALGAGGLLAGLGTDLNDRLAADRQQQSLAQARLPIEQQQALAQYQALDTLMAQTRALWSYVSQQFAPQGRARTPAPTPAAAVSSGSASPVATA